MCTRPRSPRAKARLFAALVVAGVALSATSSKNAKADASADAASKAAELKEQGNKAFDDRRYQQALALYAEAYGLTQDPALLYNKGRALEALGDFPAALEAQETFDAKASPELKQKVPGLAKLLADLRAHVATLELHVNVDAAEVRAGDRVLGVTGKKNFALNAGAIHIRVSHEGFFPLERDLTLEGGRTTVLDLTLLSKADRGVLVVRSPVAGAQVTVDGVAFGIVPTETPVMPGAHRIHLAREGYKPGDTTALLAAGERKEVDVPLEAETAVYKKWWFWTGVGLAIAGGVVLTYALTSERSPDSGTIAPGKYKVPSLIQF